MILGGKRTGDLIARISNDTERLCNFLSINLIDFGTDALTFTGDASTKIFLLTQTRPSSGLLQVTVNGSLVTAGTTTYQYSSTNNAVVFTSAPASGVIIQAVYTSTDPIDENDFIGTGASTYILAQVPR